jgi:hypothetical protein
MSKAIRWSEKNYTDHLNRLAKSAGTEPASRTSSPHEKSEGGEVKRTASRIERRDRAIKSIKESIYSGTFLAGEYIELVFPGAIALSQNSLYALTHWERIAYKKAWHQAVEWAFQAVAGGARKFPPLDTYYVSYHIQAPRLRDIDAYEGSLKWIVDGAVRTGIAIDDGPTYWLSFDRRKVSKGPPTVTIRFHHRRLEQA